MIIKSADLNDIRVVRLLQFHLSDLHETVPPDSGFALDADDLRDPNVAFMSAWEGETLLGFAALREISPVRGEITSMRTDPAYTGKGVAHALLYRLLDLAKSRGYRWISLETGMGEAFEAAQSLYKHFGFIEGQPFADHAETGCRQFYHLDLTPPVVRSRLY